jgi:hypothetical protein
MRRSRLVAPALLAAVALPSAAAAQPNIYTRMFDQYSSTGFVNPCAFTAGQLNTVLKGIDLYQQAYSADFPNAISSALSDRASGSCSKGGSSAAPAAQGSAGVPIKLGPLTAATDAPLPAPIVILAVLAGVVALLGAGAAVIRARGWDPRWGPAARQSLGEAGYRLDGALRDASDRLRRRID